MLEYAKSRPIRTIGPHNEVLTRDDLPPPGLNRWVASRKAQVVAAVQSGLLPIEEALERYNLSLAEFYGWQAAMDRAGVPGLRVAAVQRERTLRRSQHLLDA